MIDASASHRKNAPPTRSVISGGPGSDTYRPGTGAAVIHIDLAAGTSKSVDAVDELNSIENADTSLTFKGTQIKGDDGPNRLIGGDGEDLLVGRAGDDFLDGRSQMGSPQDEARDGDGTDTCQDAETMDSCEVIDP